MHVPHRALPPQLHQSPGDAAAELFQDADANGDGILHLIEMVQLFDRYDSNGTLIKRYDAIGVLRCSWYDNGMLQC